MRICAYAHVRTRSISCWEKKEVEKYEKPKAEKKDTSLGKWKYWLFFPINPVTWKWLNHKPLCAYGVWARKLKHQQQASKLLSLRIPQVEPTDTKQIHQTKNYYHALLLVKKRISEKKLVALQRKLEPNKKKEQRSTSTIVKKRHILIIRTP